MELKDEEREDKKKKGRWIIIAYAIIPIICLAGMILFGNMIIKKWKYTSISKKEVIDFSIAEIKPQEPVTNQADYYNISAAHPNPSEVQPHAVSPTSPQTAPTVSYNYDALIVQAPTATGFLNIADTNIQYPIMWSADDPEYYVHHSASGMPSENGAIFLDTQNSPDFSDRVSVIFGHNITTGVMFRHLNDFVSTDGYLESHTEAYIVNDTATMHYTIAAAKVIEPDEVYDMYDVTSCENIMGIDIPDDSRIVLFVTCYTKNNNKRVCVLAYSS